MTPDTPRYFHYWAASNSPNTGKWFDQSTSYSPTALPRRLLEADPPKTDLLMVNPLIRKLVFAYSVVKLGELQFDFHASMKRHGWNASLEITSDQSTYKIEASKSNALVTPGGDSNIDNLDAAIDTALNECQKKGDFDASDTWTLDPAAVSTKRIDSPHREAITY